MHGQLGLRLRSLSFSCLTALDGVVIGVLSIFCICVRCRRSCIDSHCCLAGFRVAAVVCGHNSLLALTASALRHQAKCQPEFHQFRSNALSAWSFKYSSTVHLVFTGPLKLACNFDGFRIYCHCAIGVGPGGPRLATGGPRYAAMRPNTANLRINVGSQQGVAS